jgi:hypothetical protein
MEIQYDCGCIFEMYYYYDDSFFGQARGIKLYDNNIIVCDRHHEPLIQELSEGVEKDSAYRLQLIKDLTTPIHNQHHDQNPARTNKKK